MIAVLPEIGNNTAATVAIQLLNDFPSVRFSLLVGIGGGVPDKEDGGDDIRLGDVVVSKESHSNGTKRRGPLPIPLRIETTKLRP